MSLYILKELYSLLEAKSEKETKTKTKTDGMKDHVKMDRDEHYPEPSKPKGDVKISTASSDKTTAAVKNVKLDDQSLAHLLNLAMSTDADDIDADAGVIDVTKPTPNLLPKVISTAMLAAGMVDPEFHMVKHLPGYMSAAIRSIGKAVFAPFTKTAIADIQVIANVNGSGPNTDRELNAVASFLKKEGTVQQHLEMEFQEKMPGYKADIRVATFANYTFMMVQDHAGKYVYAWPSTDNKTKVTDKSVERLKLH